MALEDIYQEGQLVLKESVVFAKPVKVIVTFLEEPDSITEKKIDLTQFSFARARMLSKEIKDTLSDVLIEERRDVL